MALRLKENPNVFSLFWLHELSCLLELLRRIISHDICDQSKVQKLKIGWRR